jgi:hypothetical protein
MDRDEWRRLAAAVNSDIDGMSRAAQTKADVRAILEQRRQRPTEEQFIDEDAFDIRVWKTHRLGLDLSDVKGADLYYELGDLKFVLVQYKIENSSGRIKLDVQQLRDLQNACPVACLPTQRFSCGSWYALRKTAGETTYFPACEARQHFGRYKSRKSEFFINGLTKTQFQIDFGVCRIGARTEIVNLDIYEETALSNDHVFIHAENVSGGRNAL